MKKKFLSFAICLSAAAIWSCNNSGESTATTDSTTHASSTDTTGNMATTPSTTTAQPANNTPLGKADSSFVMAAAVGGLMEVEAGKVAQDNAQNQRVKDFGGMMVADHSKANDELKSYASGHNITVPATLPAAKQKEVDALKNMKGAAFDKHYVSMMVEDHQKDVAEFKKQSTGAKDDQLKAWVTNTLPTLQKHLDSIQAIKKAMK
ncbi:MAG: DUF4142 domain-containing protein [Flavisolibacter sp.]